VRIKIAEPVLRENAAVAAEVRQRLTAGGIVMINVLGSPGAGKTSLLEHTIATCEEPVAVIEGDLATAIDAERIARHGARVIQLNTRGGCHLDANMVQQALADLDLSGVRLVLTENVGNLVCPADFDLGETARVVVASAPEGADKPAKYPIIFRTAAAVVLNKSDLLPVVPFDLAFFRATLGKLNPSAPIITVSCATGEGLPEWMAWVRGILARQ
jgi:hydrogenase nickel incorporation protein HypB